MELIDTFLNVSELKEWEKSLTTDGRHMLTGTFRVDKSIGFPAPRWDFRPVWFLEGFQTGVWRNLHGIRPRLW